MTKPAADADYLLHPVDRDESDLAVLLFTSGTAGDPKAAMLTHGNLTANLRQMLGIPEILRADDVGLVALPLFHVFGLNVALGLSLATGAALVLDTRFDAVALAQTGPGAGRDDPARRPHHVRGVGRRPRRRRDGAAARWPACVGPSRARPRSTPTWRRDSSAATAIEIWQGYGLTEASPAVSTSLGTGRNRPGSVGRPLPGVEVQLVDEEGEPVLEGDPGEIWVRGANVFAGYWRDADGHVAGAHRRRMVAHGRHRRDRRGRRPLRRRPLQGSRHRLGVQRVPRRGRAGGGVGARCRRGGGDRPARPDHGRGRRGRDRRGPRGRW